MDLKVTEESFTSLDSCWQHPGCHLNWDSIFVLPPWLRSWWQAFQPETKLYLRAVRQASEIIGIAPLQVKGDTASFIGSNDVCDYLDFVVSPGKGQYFFTALLDDLAQNGITRLNLEYLHPEATALTDLITVAQQKNYRTLCHDDALSLEMDLPATWEDYLARLDKKERHEVRRKLRRLESAGEINYHCEAASAGLTGLLDNFLNLFALSFPEKAEFMTAPREAFFRTVAGAMAAAGRLHFGILKVNRTTAAMTMLFEYHDTVYLYNSAFDPAFSYLSVGIMSHVLCIRESIQQGRKRWNFLKGDEPYKYDLGGTAVPLHRCQITMI